MAGFVPKWIVFLRTLLIFYHLFDSSCSKFSIFLLKWSHAPLVKKYGVCFSKPKLVFKTNTIFSQRGSKRGKGLSKSLYQCYFRLVLNVIFKFT